MCELLRANLYEFHKFNRESGGEVYFTMPRLQVGFTVFFPDNGQGYTGLGVRNFKECVFGVSLAF